MQIKEYEAYTLKECLQQVRDDLGPEAVILETRKIRKGGVLGLGARDAVCIVAATGIAVKEDIAQAKRASGGQSGSGPASSGAGGGRGKEGNNEGRKEGGKDVGKEGTARSTASGDRAPQSQASVRNSGSAERGNTRPENRNPVEDRADVGRPQARAVAGQSAAVAAARNAYARNGATSTSRTATPPAEPVRPVTRGQASSANSASSSAQARAMERMRSAGFFPDDEPVVNDGENSDANGIKNDPYVDQYLDEYEDVYEDERGDAPGFAPRDGSLRANGARSTTGTQARSTVIETREAPVRPSASKNGADSSERVPARETPREDRRFSLLEQAMREIREGLSALQREQKESHERTVSAVVSAVTPAIQAVGNMAHLTSLAEAQTPRFPDLFARLTGTGVAEGLAHELLDGLPDFGAWSEEAQEPLAVSALRDLIGRRVSSAGPISLTPGHLKAVALIGPTGVGKTTTIAKLAAHFALVQKQRVALLTMDTYRIAAVEQLKVYSQILDVPLGVAYSQAEALEVVEQFADYDLLLIDTAGRSQKNIMQVGELKTLLEAVGCETHLVLSAQTKEQDMVESAQRFSAARVDRLIFSKLDETDSYGTLLNVADRTGIPLSYLTTGQKVPEDLELADGGRLAGLLLD